MQPAAANRPRLPSPGVTQPIGESSRAEQEGAGELRRRQHDIRRRPQRAGDQHQHRERQAAAERDHCRPAHRLRRGPQRNQNAAEADQDSAPAPPADMLMQHDCRQRRDEDRTGQIIGNDVGERQIDGGEKKRRDLEGREHDPEQLQPRPFQPDERGAMPPYHRRKHDERRAGAQPQQLADRIGRDHVLAQRIAEREHEDRQQHQADAGQPRGARVLIGRQSREQIHSRKESLIL